MDNFSFRKWIKIRYLHPQWMYTARHMDNWEIMVENIKDISLAMKFECELGKKHKN